ncbi:conserved hypothetical protein, partial [Ricinus communis]
MTSSAMVRRGTCSSTGDTSFASFTGSSLLGPRGWIVRRPIRSGSSVARARSRLGQLRRRSSGAMISS